MSHNRGKQTFGRGNNRHNGYSHERNHGTGGRGGSSSHYNHSSSSDRHANTRHSHSKNTPYPGSEICKFAIERRCTQPEGTCHFPHLVVKIGETKGHRGSIKDVTMWTEMSQLLTCSTDMTIKIWKCSDWTEVTTISLSDLPVSDDSSQASSSSSSRHSKNHARSPLPGPRRAGISTMTLVGPWLLVGYENYEIPHFTHVGIGGIRAWHLENPDHPVDFKTSLTMPFAHGTCVTAVVMVVLDGIPTVFSGDGAGVMKVWQLDPSTQSFRPRGTLEGHTRAITCLKLCPLSQDPLAATVLVSASIDGTIKLWHTTNWTCVGVLGRELQGHTDAVTDLETFHGEESFLISVGLDKHVKVWRLAPPFTQMFDESTSVDVTTCCLSADISGTPLLLLGSTEGSIVVKELPSLETKTTLSQTANVGHRDTVRRIVPGPANTFFSVGDDMKMIAWQWTGAVSAIKSKPHA